MKYVIICNLKEDRGEKMKKILDWMEKGLLVVNKQGYIVYHNQYLTNNQWRPGGVVEGQHINELLVVSNQEMTALEMLIKNEKSSYHGYLKQANNQELYVKIRVIEDDWEGEPAYYCLITRQESNLGRANYLRSILNNIPYVLWVKNRDGKYSFANQSFINQINKAGNAYDLLDILEKTDEEVWDEPIRTFLKDFEAEVRDTKAASASEIKLQHGDKEEWYTVRLIPLLDKNEEVEYILGMRENRTINKQVESAIENNLVKTHQYMDIQANPEYLPLDTFNDINCIRKEIRQKLNAVGLAIGVFDQNYSKINLVCKDGTLIKHLKGINELRITDKKSILNSKNWGFIPVDKYIAYMHRQTGLDIRNHIKELSQYYGRYPLFCLNKLIGVIFIDYGNTKPNMNDTISWFPEVCSQLAILIENKILTNSIKLRLHKNKEFTNELEYFINIAVDLTAIINKQGSIKKVNENWEEQLGWQMSEILEHSVLEFIHPEEIQGLYDYINKITNDQSEKKTLITRLKQKCGKYKWYEIQVQYINEIEQVLCTAVDITERKQKEEEWTVNTELETIENIQNEFFSNISHEFRTPINVILTSAQLLSMIQEKDGNIEAQKLKSYLTKIKLNSYRLLRLSNNLVDLTKLNVDCIELRPMNVDIVEAICSIVTTAKSYVQKEGIYIELKTTLQSLKLICDIDKIERMILNLLSNAIKYNKDNNKITVSLYVQEQKFCIEVKDRGIGIPEEKVRMIFCNFIQVNPLLNRPSEGCGMGLPITKAFTELHGGEITVKSKEGEGSTFIIKLPMNLVDNEDIAYKPFKTALETCKIELSDICFYTS